MRPPAPVTRTVGREAAESAMTSRDDSIRAGLPLSVGGADSLGPRRWFENRLEGRADLTRPKAKWRARGAEGAHVTHVAVGPHEPAQPSPCKARALNRTG